MFSEPLLRYKLVGARLEPHYLDARYAPLIRDLLLAYQSSSEQPYHRLEERLRLLPAIHLHERRLVSGLRQVIEENCRVVVIGKPPELRERVFLLAGEKCVADLEEIRAAAAAANGLDPDTLNEQLYGDLKPMRRLDLAAPPPAPAEIISRYNFRLLQGFFLRAAHLRVETEGNALAIYRFAKLNGLLVEVKEREESTRRLLQLEITGPLALFQSTRRYGAALARFLPACCAGSHFRLKALLQLQDQECTLEVDATDRILPPHRLPQIFASRLEKRFFHDFERLDSSWEIIREESILPVGQSVFIPDFTVRHRLYPDYPIFLEIVGFWTAEYLERKRAILRQLPQIPLILCIDQSLRLDNPQAAGPAGDPGGRFPVILFKGRVPARTVLQRLEEVLETVRR